MRAHIEKSLAPLKHENTGLLDLLDKAIASLRAAEGASTRAQEDALNGVREMFEKNADVLEHRLKIAAQDDNTQKVNQVTGSGLAAVAAIGAKPSAQPPWARRL